MNAPAPAITGAPIVDPGISAGEPTVEELARLIPDDAVREEPVIPVVASEADSTTTEPIAGDPEPAAAEPVAPTPEQDAALERATRAAEQARAGSRRYAATQEALREQQAQVQRAAREAEYLRQENAEARRREQLLKQDPYAALKGLGMTDADLAARAIRENTPEAVTYRLEQQLTEERNARLHLEQRLADERRAGQQAAAEVKFTQIADDESSYPRLSQLNTTAQLAVAKAALAQIAANGYDIARLSDAQVAEASETYLRPKREPKAAAARPVAIAPSKSSGRTLTNGQSQVRTTAPAPWDSLSEEQQIAAIAAGLPEPNRD